MNLNEKALRQEAAQYALLCRISSALRHRLLGKLQPIGIMAALVERQLQGDNPNLIGARETAAKTQLRVREATACAVATLAWLTGEEATKIAFSEGVAECVDMIRTDSEMRGVTIVSSANTVDASVCKHALRMVLTAVLVAMVDVKPSPSRIELRSTLRGDQIELSIVMTHAATGAALLPLPDTRPLTWSDVEVLADLAGVTMVGSSGAPTVKCIFAVIAAQAGADKPNLG